MRAPKFKWDGLTTLYLTSLRSWVSGRDLLRMVLVSNGSEPAPLGR